MALLVRALVLVAGGALVGLGVNAVRPDGVRVRAFQAPVECGATESAPPTEIAPADAIRLCGHPEVVIADARPAQRYAEGHVAGAIHLPCEASGAVASGALARLDGAATVIVYGESTDDARPVAEGLARRVRGHVRVHVLRGGFAAWEKAGLACEAGPCDECSVSR